MANPNYPMKPPLGTETDGLISTLNALADPYRLKPLRVLEESGELWDWRLYQKAAIDSLDGSHHMGVLSIVQAHRRLSKRLCYELTEHGRVVLELARLMKRS
ncbi:MAG: hypothetical protein P4L84_06580 [Isosphaeraceae bacterium]|nr:hypothetical protein [Isosphaeraceae bacterium]